MRKLKQYTIAGSAALAVALGGTGLAVAASSPGAPQPAGDVHACVKSDGSVDFLQFRPANYGHCAAGDAAWTWARTDGTAPAPTTFGVGQVKVDGTTWAQYDAAELGGSRRRRHLRYGPLQLQGRHRRLQRVALGLLDRDRLDRVPAACPRERGQHQRCQADL